MSNKNMGIDARTLSSEQIDQMLEEHQKAEAETFWNQENIKDEDQYTEIICPVICEGCGRIVPLDKMCGEGSNLLCPECHTEKVKEHCSY